MKWVINLDNGYQGIEEADTEELARKQTKLTLRGSFGEPAKDYDPLITSVKPATEDDLSWIKGMGGRT